MKSFVLRTDASGVGEAAVLLQENEGKLYRVGYASRKLNLAEAKYPITEKECLAVVWGIRCFKLYLAGERLTLQTDHKPLKYLRNAAYRDNHLFDWAFMNTSPIRRTLGQISGAKLDITGFSC